MPDRVRGQAKPGGLGTPGRRGVHIRCGLSWRRMQAMEYPYSMNILYTNFHDSPGKGGHSVYILSLIEELAVRHRICVASPAASALNREARKIDGVRVVDQSYVNRVPHRLAGARRLYGLIRDARIDVVHVNGSADHRTALLACLACGSKRPAIVFTKHNDVPVAWPGAAIRARLGTDYAIGVSGYVATLLHRSPYRHRPIAAIGNGIDTSWFSPWPSQAAALQRRTLLGRRADRCRLLVGSNAGTDDYKGWINMVYALQHLGRQAEGIYIALAGEKIDEKQRMALAATGLQDRVVFAGHLNDVRPFLAALDVGFVLSRREGSSIACREMMAMGIPVIVSSAGGLPENVAPQRDGWIVPGGAPAAVAAVLKSILDDPGRLPAMKRAAREKSEALFRRADFARRTEEVYRAALRVCRDGP